MPRLVLPLSLALALSAAAVALSGPAAPDEVAVRRAVETLAASPLTPEAEEAAAVIMAFADSSEAVTVTLGESAVPWVKDGKTPHGELLLAAFIGGNVVGQLDAGFAHDDPWSGELQVFRAYRAMKVAEPKLRVASIEQMLDEAKKGKLAARLLGAPAAPAKPGKPPAKSPPNGLAALKGGAIPDEATAIRIALAIWEPIYGADVIAGEKPYKATLENGVWTVSGSLPKDMLGGVAEIDVAQKDGQVLRVIHGE